MADGVKSKLYCSEDLAAKIIYYAHCLVVELDQEPRPPLLCAETLAKMRELLAEEKRVTAAAMEAKRLQDESNT